MIIDLITRIKPMNVKLKYFQSNINNPPCHICTFLPLLVLRAWLVSLEERCLLDFYYLKEKKKKYRDIIYTTDSIRNSQTIGNIFNKLTFFIHFINTNKQQQQ